MKKPTFRERLANWIRGGAPRDETSSALWGSGGGSAAGQLVNEWTALSISAVYAAVRLLSETKACLPLGIFKDSGDGRRQPAYLHPAYKLIHTAPNREMTAKKFWELMEVWKLLWGHAYAEIQWDQGGNARALWPIEPWRVTPRRSDDDELVFDIWGAGQAGGKRTLADADILRMPNLSWDGVCGRSVIAWARESLGLTLAAQQYGSSFFGSGGVPSGVLEHPGKLNEPTRRQMRKEWHEVHSPKSGGTNNEVAVLWEGMKYNKIGIPPEDAQFLETRRFQVTEVARWFNVPPHMLRDLDRATFSNIEHQQIEFVIYSLMPGLVEWEQEINRKLLGSPNLFAKYNVRGLLRGDSKAQEEFFKAMFGIGVYSVNDILELLDENPIGEEGDQRFVPLNMVPLDQAAAMAAKNSAPVQTPAEPDDPRASDDGSGGGPDAGDPKAPPGDGGPDGSPAGGLSRSVADAASILREAAQELYAETLGRMIRREAAAARRAAKNHNQFLAWMDGFYPKHMEILTKVLERPCRLLQLVNPSGPLIPAAEDAKSLAEAWVRSSRDDLLKAAECTPAEFPAAVEKCIQGWESDGAYQRFLKQAA